MQLQSIQSFTLPNGFVAILEEMPDVQSAAFSLLIPAGCIYEIEGVNGTASALGDLVTRGAGSRDSRTLATDLDNLGVQRSEQVGWNFLSLSGALLAENLLAALEIYADIAQRPHLPEDEFEPVMAGLEQGLLALEDEPQRKLSTELRRRTYHSPWNRPTEGDLADLPNISMDVIREHAARGFRPNGAILGIAGRFDPDELRRHIEELFGDWPSVTIPDLIPGPRGRQIDHVMHPSTQMQIGLTYPAPPYGDPDYYAAWAAASVLGGGPSARLFTEVREKRGLCYSVQASLNSLKTEGRTMIYAGTTTERAQETLDVILKELWRLNDGMGEDELQRCLARAKSSLIMQQESTSARAASLARDWFHLGRVTTLEEVRHELESLTVHGVLAVAMKYAPADLTVLTLGAQPLEIRI
jgi:predicted Zn-dependent peptidase